MLQTATGCSQMKDGPGFRTIPGDGHLFIMAVGIMILITDQCGFPVTNGDLDGLPGECRKVIMAGRL